jgi:type I restriction enzyme S subunit
MLKHLAIPAFSHDEQTSISAALKDATSHSAILEQTISKKQAVKRGMMQQLLTGRVRLPGFAGPWSEGIFEQLAIPSRQRAMPRDVPPATLLVELEHLESGTGRLHGRSQAGEAVSLKAVFKPGDVLFGKLRAYLRKYWYADAAGLCTTEIWVLRACTGVCDRFVRYVVESDQFIDAASGAYGTHMPRSDWGMIRGLSVDIPPYEEQVTIASALDAVDTEIGVLLARLAKARDVKQGMMQQLLTGRTLLPVKEHAA